MTIFWFSDQAYDIVKVLISLASPRNLLIYELELCSTEKIKGLKGSDRIHQLEHHSHSL